MSGLLLRVSLIVLVVYGGLLYLTYFGFTHVPTGFIPAQDKGYLLVDVRLPDSASLERTREVMRQVEQIARGGESKDANHGDGGGIHGIAHTIAISGTRCPEREWFQLRLNLRDSRRVSSQTRR